jgi:hypothetical protein
MINPHFLELFYYLGRYGGVSQAIRRMPYGIRQCTLSRQIIQLEEQVGARLCERPAIFVGPEFEPAAVLVEGDLPQRTQRTQRSLK